MVHLGINGESQRQMFKVKYSSVVGGGGVVVNSDIILCCKLLTKAK